MRNIFLNEILSKKDKMLYELQYQKGNNIKFSKENLKTNIFKYDNENYNILIIELDKEIKFNDNEQIIKFIIPSKFTDVNGNRYKNLFVSYTNGKYENPLLKMLDNLNPIRYELITITQDYPCIGIQGDFPLSLLLSGEMMIEYIGSVDTMVIVDKNDEISNFKCKNIIADNTLSLRESFLPNIGFPRYFGDIIIDNIKYYYCDWGFDVKTDEFKELLDTQMFILTDKAFNTTYSFEKKNDKWNGNNLDINVTDNYYFNGRTYDVYDDNFYGYIRINLSCNINMRIQLYLMGIPKEIILTEKYKTINPIEYLRANCGYALYKKMGGSYGGGFNFHDIFVTDEYYVITYTMPNLYYPTKLPLVGTSGPFGINFQGSNNSIHINFTAEDYYKVKYNAIPPYHYNTTSVLYIDSFKMNVKLNVENKIIFNDNIEQNKLITYMIAEIVENNKYLNSYIKGTNPFEYLVKKMYYDISPNPNASTYLYTPYNIKTDGIVTGTNIESLVTSLNNEAFKSEIIEGKISELNQVISKLQNIVTDIQAKVDMYNIINSAVNFVTGIAGIAFDGFGFGIVKDVTSALEDADSIIKGVGSIVFGAIDENGKPKDNAPSIDTVITIHDLTNLPTFTETSIITGLSTERLIDYKIQNINTNINTEIKNINDKIDSEIKTINEKIDALTPKP